MPLIDHRGPQFQHLGERVLAKLKAVFKTQAHVFVYAGSGTGAWEAAFANLLSPGDGILVFETDHFAALWGQMAGRLRLKVERLGSDWRGGARTVQRTTECHLKYRFEAAEGGGVTVLWDRVGLIGLQDIVGEAAQSGATPGVFRILDASSRNVTSREWWYAFSIPSVGEPRRRRFWLRRDA